MKKLLLLSTFSFILSTCSQAQEYATLTLTGEHQGTGTFSNAALSDFTWQVNGTLNQEVQILDNETFDDGNEFENIFGQADNEQNLRIQVMPNGAGTAGQPITSKATLTINFDQTTLSGVWGFCLVDIDVENILISAIDENDNEVSHEDINNWLIELFDTNLLEDGINIPKWDATNSALLGSDTPDEYVVYNNLVIGSMPSSEAAAAFFMPDMKLESLTIIFENLQENYATSYHFYVASLNESAIPENQETVFKIYPNPAGSVVSLQLAVGSQQSAVVEIYDLYGKKLLEKQIPKGSKDVTLNVSDLQSGVYLCRLIMENKCIKKKFILK